MQTSLISIGYTLVAGTIGLIAKEIRAVFKAQEKHMARLDEAVKDNEDRILKIETRNETTIPTLEEVRSRQQADGVRLAASEITLVSIKESIRTIETNQNIMSTKLDKIPELTVALTSALEKLNNVCDTIVPRAEIEARFTDVNRRIE